MFYFNCKSVIRMENNSCVCIETLENGAFEKLELKYRRVQAV